MKESSHEREFSYFVDAGAEIGSYFIAAVNNGTGPDEANARLIAAAPDLLEACQMVDEWYDLVKQNYPEMMRPFEATRAAIAKALGE